MKRILYFALAAILSSCGGAVVKQDADFTLTDGWKIQSATVAGETPQPSDTWYSAKVPSTVIGTLTEHGMYADAFVGTNYDKTFNRDDFKEPWWYVNTFSLPALKEGQNICLDFEGISYSAEVWLNGVKIASRDQMTGPFRQFRFDVTDFVAESNTLAVKVFRAEDGDFNIGFVDWNPRAADESMGIFRPVWVRYSNSVALSNTAVKSKVNTETLNEAWLTVETTLENKSSDAVRGQLVCSFDGRTVKKPVTVEALQTLVVSTDEIKVKNPRLWWCHNLGNPEMYDMNVSFVADGKESDSQEVSFGIRDISSYMAPDGHRGFMLNGKKVLVKGAGWTDDIFLRNPDSRNEIELDFVKDMNMNAVRFENVWGTSQNVYDLCDRKGLLALVGWSCFWEWEVYSRTPNDEYGCIKTEEDMNLIAESFRDQVLWLRNHPSIIAWYTGSDMLPRPELEKKYLAVLEETDDRPYVASAKGLVSEITGPVGMKMVGPYDYQAPEYWYNPNAAGGAFGFNTETGIGAQMPMRESIEKMIPADKLWPMGKEYDYHCTTAGEAMHSLDVLKQTALQRYGKSDNLDSFLKKAHHIDYDGTRAMFEGFRVNNGRATGVIQWMLNSAWPSLYWQMYDWYLVPTAGYWSVKKALMPAQLVYNYYEKTVVAVCDELEDRKLTASMKIYDLGGKLITDVKGGVIIPSGGSVKVFDVPAPSDISFVFLSLEDQDGKTVATNEYCLSYKEDIHDWKHYNWIRTPLAQSADYSALSTLAEAELSADVEKSGDTITLNLKNNSEIVAFFTRVAAKDAGGEIFVPGLWSDNFVTIAPGATISLTCRASYGIDEVKKVEVSGWNSRKIIVNI